MHKKKELFLFFNITDAAGFKTHLGKDLHPRLTSTVQALSDSSIANTMINIAFSSKGLQVLGVRGSPASGSDAVIFGIGQAADASNLGDPNGTNGWQPEFRNGVHGVLLIASDNVETAGDVANNLHNVFNNSFTSVYQLVGEARPNDQEGHERKNFFPLHITSRSDIYYLPCPDFGYKDGIAQPAITGFNQVANFLGQTPVKPGIILAGEDGDTSSQGRPAWAKDGSFLVFRQLKQLVPEFNKFLLDNALKTANGTDLSPQEGADLLGARMIGRWKSVS
jgi:Dyp-type peroxidase family